MKLPRFFGRKVGSAAGLSLGLILVSSLLASPPDWWSERGATNTNPADDYAAANLGQLKQFASKAADELNAHLPGGAGTTINNLVASWRQPPATGVVRDDYAAVNLGQLKTIAKPFYDRLIAVQYTSTYPWNAPGHATADDYALANLGQLKNIFSFDLTGTDATHDTSGNGLPDWWEKYFFGASGINPDADADGDGLTNAEEWETWLENGGGTDPNNGDSDGDGILDGQDQYPNDPNRSEDVPVQTYAAIDVSGDSTGGADVTQVALDENGKMAFGYTSGSGNNAQYHVKKWENGFLSFGASFNLVGAPYSEGNYTLVVHYAPDFLNASGGVYGHCASIVTSSGDHAGDEKGCGFMVTSGNPQKITAVGPFSTGDPEEFLLGNSIGWAGASGYIGNVEWYPNSGYINYAYCNTTGKYYVFAPFKANSSIDTGALVMTYDTPFVPSSINSNGWVVGYRVNELYHAFGTLSACVWNGDQVIDLPGSEINIKINDQNQVINTGDYDDDAYLWQPNGDGTNGSIQYLADLLPAKYQNQLKDIVPRLLSNQDEDGNIRILFDAQSLEGSPTASWVNRTFVLTVPQLEEGDANPEALESSVQQVAFPSKSALQIKGLNSRGLLAAIGKINVETSSFRAAILPPLTTTPNPIPITGTAQAKIVYGSGFKMPGDISGITVTLGSQQAYDIRQDSLDPHIIYFTPPASPTGEAGMLDLEISGLQIQGWPTDSNGEFKLKNYIEYTIDTIKGTEAFTASNKANLEEAKSRLAHLKDEAGISDIEAIRQFDYARDNYAATESGLFKQFFDGKMPDKEAFAKFRNSTSTFVSGIINSYPAGVPSAPIIIPPPAPAPPPTSSPIIGTPTFFSEVKAILSTSGSPFYFSPATIDYAGNGQQVPTGAYFVVFDANKLQMTTHVVGIAGKTIDNVIAANPAAEIIVNGALCNYGCKNWPRRDDPKKEPLQTIGQVIKNGVLQIPTSTSASKQSWKTAILRYWLGQSENRSAAANAGTAASYEFGGKGNPPARLQDAIGGLVSLIWPTRHKQTAADDSDLFVYEQMRLGGPGGFVGFNIIGIDRDTGMIIIFSKQNYVPMLLKAAQSALFDSGVDEAMITDGGGSTACWAKGVPLPGGFLSKSGRHTAPPNNENTVTNYFIFKPISN